MTRATALVSLAMLAACAGGRASVAKDAAGPAASAASWFKGNTHTHTLWSDGDDFPEMVAEWYKLRGYHFLAVTDHNTVQSEERWWPQGAGEVVGRAVQAYRERFGARVEERRTGSGVELRLRRASEYRAELEEPGRFLLLSGEEVTQYQDGRAAHVNVLNLAERIAPQGGASPVEIVRRDLDAAAAQERGTGRPLVAVLNHPNFVWSQTAEDLLALPTLRFLEVYNGHPGVNVRGDGVRASSERLWDIVLSMRFARGGAPLYGVATDDAHDYLDRPSERRYPGRGWVAVRASRLHADSLMRAMQRGDFYASTGVVLADVRRDGPRLSIAVSADAGVRYTTQWIGTRRGYDTTSVAVHDSAGRAVTRRYSTQIGEVLAESRGTTASYTMRGDELYVRARVVSTREKANAAWTGEVEMAWTQPVRP